MGQLHGCYETSVMNYQRTLVIYPYI